MTRIQKVLMSVVYGAVAAILSAIVGALAGHNSDPITVAIWATAGVYVGLTLGSDG